MSAGEFSLSKYAASYDAAAIHPIRVQPETIAASIGGTTNSAPTGALNNPISASVSLSNREIGLRPRFVTLQAPATGQPAGYKAGGVTRIPALQEAFWNAAVKGASVTYLGISTWTVISREAEQAK